MNKKYILIALMCVIAVGCIIGGVLTSVPNTTDFHEKGELDSTIIVNDTPTVFTGEEVEPPLVKRAADESVDIAVDTNYHFTGKGIIKVYNSDNELVDTLNVDGTVVYFVPRGSKVEIEGNIDLLVK